MLVLALDTATPTVLVGVIELGLPAEPGWSAMAQRAVEHVASANRHAETLGTLIPAVLHDAGGSMSDLGAIVVGLGPGPFTGLRVGIVTAAALGDALGIPVYGVCTHDAMAIGYAADEVTDQHTAADEAFVVVTDARRRECYWAGYDAAGIRISGPHVQRPTDLLARPDWPPNGPVIGDPAFAEALGLAIRPARPEPGGLVLAAPGLAAGLPPAPLEPLYLRRPDTMPPSPRKQVSRA